MHPVIETAVSASRAEMRGVSCDALHRALFKRARELGLTPHQAMKAFALASSKENTFAAVRYGKRLLERAASERPSNEPQPAA